MSDTRIEITRAEFERLWGYPPLAESVGVMLMGADRKTIIAEYVFMDGPRPEVAELERILKLYTRGV